MTVEVNSMDSLMKVFGLYDKNLDILTEEFGVNIGLIDGRVEISGPEENAELCRRAIEALAGQAPQKEAFTSREIRFVCDLVREGKEEEIGEILSGVVAVTARGKPVRCKTGGQKKYVTAIAENSIVIGVGPAGTGKTYLAVAMAAAAYKNKEVEKIILTRPAVEAGEKLGFLPGDLQDKVDPYLRPLYDALGEMFGAESYQKLMERQVIEVAPLAYMRGRTLSNAFIILDEAQNTTPEQMKMFLTRIGEGSKMIVNGDITQIDLPEGKSSGLRQAMRILEGVKDIKIIRLSERDVVRHELVQNIIKAYEREAANKGR